MQLGAKHVELPFIEFGQLSTVLYFLYFSIIMYFVTLVENSLLCLNFIVYEHTLNSFRNGSKGTTYKYHTTRWFLDLKIIELENLLNRLMTLRNILSEHNNLSLEQKIFANNIFMDFFMYKFIGTCGGEHRIQYTTPVNIEKVNSAILYIESQLRI
jgi:hypothetical protein